ncbi:MAG: hypothetical protein OCD01_04720 [Fibrobacterales bacterium]
MHIKLLASIPLCILLVCCTRSIQPILFDTATLNSIKNDEGLLAFMVNQDVQPLIKVTVKNLTTGDRYMITCNHKNIAAPLIPETLTSDNDADSVATVTLAGLEIPVNTIDTAALKTAIYLYTLPAGPYIFEYSDFIYNKNHRSRVSLEVSDTINISPGQIQSLGFIDIEFEERLFGRSIINITSTNESLQPLLNLTGIKSNTLFKIIDDTIEARTYRKE